MKTIMDMALDAGFTERGLIRAVDSITRFAALVRADEREALIRYFNEHWRSDWSDGQIIEALEARGNT